MTDREDERAHWSRVSRGSSTATGAAQSISGRTAATVF